MSDPIEIIERGPEDTLEIEAETNVFKMPVTIKNSYKAILDLMKKREISPVNPPYVKYIKVDWNEVNTESKLSAFFKMFSRKWYMMIGFPVPEGVNGEGNIVRGKFEGGRYVTTIHRGEYRKVGETYSRMLEFIKEKNLAIKEESYEIYSNDPRTTKKEDLETIVLIPIKE